MKKERERQSLSTTQKRLVIMDISKGQVTSDVNESLKNHLCPLRGKCRANMTQPVDVTVSGYCKKFLKKKFTSWYAGNYPSNFWKGSNLKLI